MFRSHGEVHFYAKRVFALYSVEGYLNISHFKFAWFVLWGRWPDANIMELLFSKQCAVVASDIKETSDAGKGVFSDVSDIMAEKDVEEKVVERESRLQTVECRRINEDEFTRFVITYFDAMGADAVQFGAVGENKERLETCGGDSIATLHDPAVAVARASKWVHFEALAGTKGYVTFDDILSTERVNWLRQPVGVGMDSYDAAQHGSNDSTATHTSACNGRVSLLAHAFAIADRDGDGRLVFGDIEGYL